MILIVPKKTLKNYIGVINIKFKAMKDLTELRMYLEDLMDNYLPYDSCTKNLDSVLNMAYRICKSKFISQFYYGNVYFSCRLDFDYSCSNEECFRVSVGFDPKSFAFSIYSTYDSEISIELYLS